MRLSSGGSGYSIDRVARRREERKGGDASRVVPLATLARERGIISSLERRSRSLSRARARAGTVSSARAPWAVSRRLRSRATIDARAFGAALGASGASVSKLLEGQVLSMEKGFSDDVSRRNAIKMVLGSVFKRREATCAGADGEGEILRAALVRSCAPKQALGHVITGPMMAVQVRTWCAALSGDAARASVVDACRAAVAELHAAALAAAISAYDAQVAAETPEGGLASGAMEALLRRAAEDANRALFAKTAAVSPVPKAAGKLEQPPTAELRAEVGAPPEPRAAEAFVVRLEEEHVD